MVVRPYTAHELREIRDSVGEQACKLYEITCRQGQPECLPISDIYSAVSLAMSLLHAEWNRAWDDEQAVSRMDKFCDECEALMACPSTMNQPVNDAEYASDPVHDSASSATARH